MWLTIARPRPVPRSLVEKYGRKSFSLSSRRDAAAGVGHHQLHGIGGAGLGGDVQRLDQRILHGFGGIVHQVHHHALELFADPGSPAAGPGASCVRIEMPSSRPWNTASAFRHNLIEIAARRAARWGSARTARTRPPASSPIPPLARWWPRIPQTMRAVLGRQVEAVQLARDALGGKRDGRQRILDLVRDAARHFVPGRGLLRAQQFAGVFQHHHEAGGQLLLRSAETVTARCRSCGVGAQLQSAARPRRCGARASSGT